MIQTEPDQSIKDRFQTAPFIQRRLLPGLVLLLVLLAWTNRFMTDDAFISFRYAANFAEGHGLVWNAGGEKVEGYTNFLWTLLISSTIVLGIDPVHASLIFGIASFCVTLVFTYKLSLIVFDSPTHSLAALFLLGINYTFLCYATGGIETQLQALLLLICVYLSLRLRDRTHFRLVLSLSLLVAFGLLLRLDSSVILVPVMLAACFAVFKQESDDKKRTLKIISLLGPAGILIVSWLIWKLRFYGEILPNTFYVKVGSNQFAAGLAYLYKFLVSYWLFPFPLLIAATLMSGRTRKNTSVLFLTAVTGLWLMYIAAVGGDFMEFRFLVPVMPFIFILITWVIFIAVKEKPVRIALIALVLIGDLHHVITYPRSWYRMPFGYVEPIERMNHWVYGEDAAWAEIGKVLGRELKQDTNAVIAVTAAGAIPYYSRLTAVDMHGLNDRWVARYGVEWGEKVGHQKIAPLSYLIQRNVNIVIGHPFLTSSDAEFQKDYLMQDIHRWVLRNPHQQELPANAQILEIPINDRKKLITLYLSRTPVLDNLIQTKGWQLHSLE